MNDTPKITPSVKNYFREIGKRGCQSRLQTLTKEQRVEFARMGGKAKRKTKEQGGIVGTDAANVQP